MSNESGGKEFSGTSGGGPHIFAAPGVRTVRNILFLRVWRGVSLNGHLTSQGVIPAQTEVKYFVKIMMRYDVDGTE